MLCSRESKFVRSSVGLKAVGLEQLGGREVGIGAGTGLVAQIEGGWWIGNPVCKAPARELEGLGAACEAFFGSVICRKEPSAEMTVEEVEGCTMTVEEEEGCKMPLAFT